LAQVGGRLIEGTAKKLAADFFAAFSEAVADTEEKPAPGKDAAAAAAAGIEAVNTKVLVIGGMLGLIILYFVISAL
jgi:hypothetical protein